MIGIVDYGMGNLGSVRNACAFLHREARILSDPAQAASCSALILPGVGAFGDCIRHLEQTGFAECLRDWARDGKPLMGMCLGLQALFESSEESPGVNGLGIFRGAVRRFPPSPALKVPQIGWNQVKINLPACPLFRGIPDQSHFYFVHSFHVVPADPSISAGQTDYGLSYTSVAWRDNVMATQFHPEKSHDAGLRMLDNFCAINP